MNDKTDLAAKAWLELAEAVRDAGRYMDLHTAGVIAGELNPNARVLNVLRDSLTLVKTITTPVNAPAPVELTASAVAAMDETTGMQVLRAEGLQLQEQQA